MSPNRDRSVVPFFVLTFAWSWVFFALAVPGFRAHGAEEAGPWSYAALLLGAYGPSLTALALTRRHGGGAAVRRLLAGFLAWRGRWAALLGALFLPLLLRLAAIVLLVSVPFGPLAEEVGWRGFAQPRLLERCSPVTTGLLLGLAWTAWHIPLFFSPVGTTISGKPLTVGAVAFYLALLTGLSLLIVWLSLATERPLLVGFLVHLGFNAEIYRFFFGLRGEAQDSIEQLYTGRVIASVRRWRSAPEGFRRVAA